MTDITFTVVIISILVLVIIYNYFQIKRKETNKEREQERLEENLLEKEKELIKEKTSAYEQLELHKIEEKLKQKKEQVKQEFLCYEKSIEELVNKLESEKEEVINSLLEEKKKRDAINAKALKEMEDENYQNLHTITINEQDYNDITTLLKIEKQLVNKSVLRKLIWSEYIQKPFNDMIKDVFGGKIPNNVIYCIENTTNNKKYIGLTKQLVSKRWTDHIKTSLGISGVTQSTIHKELFGNWNSFTFDVLEVVENDSKLREREKFYIDFFDTSVFGYNVKK